MVVVAVGEGERPWVCEGSGGSGGERAGGSDSEAQPLTRTATPPHPTHPPQKKAPAGAHRAGCLRLRPGVRRARGAVRGHTARDTGCVLFCCVAHGRPLFAAAPAAAAAAAAACSAAQCSCCERERGGAKKEGGLLKRCRAPRNPNARPPQARRAKAARAASAAAATRARAARRRTARRRRRRSSSSSSRAARPSRRAPTRASASASPPPRRPFPPFPFTLLSSNPNTTTPSKYPLKPPSIRLCTPKHPPKPQQTNTKADPGRQRHQPGQPAAHHLPHAHELHGL